MTEQILTIQITFADADEQQSDLATVGEIARQTVDDLRNQGYTVHPVYTGARGGNVFRIAKQIGQTIERNKDLLIALIGLATPILTFLLDRYAKQLDKDAKPAMLQQQQQSSNIFLIVNGAKILVAPEDLGDNERLLRKLLDVQPNLIDTVTREIIPEIDVQIPPKQQRRRR